MKKKYNNLLGVIINITFIIIYFNNRSIKPRVNFIFNNYYKLN